MQVKFTKMQGAGNDFVVIDSYSQIVTLNASQIKQIANRYFGVGCDQLLMVEKSTSADVDFKYRIFNADGGEVEQCGNGARCFARFVAEKGLTDKREITVETASGIIVLQLQMDGQVTVNMGAPIFEPARIPFAASNQQAQYALQLQSEIITISAVSMGNPHAVTLVSDVETAKVAQLGPQIESHTSFPQRVNAGFMQIVNAHEINLRVYERGSGETLSCGTGACAAAVSGIALGLLQSPVLVNTRGGKLNIAWTGEIAPVMMTGPAEFVFEGLIEL
ncbi:MULTISPECIES: diaminopimelate epimerase [Methylotenera]|uniref:diaminopimelate epimerase n=1 Tax=Methylotenera TaxID=359407 RepID=UPI000361B05C|nr:MULTISPECIES: diaminopimelate epimerase [Methylotenera]